MYLFVENTIKLHTNIFGFSELVPKNVTRKAKEHFKGQFIS